MAARDRLVEIAKKATPKRKEILSWVLLDLDRALGDAEKCIFYRSIFNLRQAWYHVYRYLQTEPPMQEAMEVQDAVSEFDGEIERAIKKNCSCKFLGFKEVHPELV